MSTFEERLRGAGVAAMLILPTDLFKPCVGVDRRRLARPSWRTIVPLTSYADHSQ